MASTTKKLSRSRTTLSRKISRCLPMPGHLCERSACAMGPAWVTRFHLMSSLTSRLAESPTIRVVRALHWQIRPTNLRQAGRSQPPLRDSGRNQPSFAATMLLQVGSSLPSSRRFAARLHSPPAPPSLYIKTRQDSDGSAFPAMSRPGLEPFRAKSALAGLGRVSVLLPGRGVRCPHWQKARSSPPPPPQVRGEPASARRAGGPRRDTARGGLD